MPNSYLNVRWEESAGTGARTVGLNTPQLPPQEFVQCVKTGRRSGVSWQGTHSGPGQLTPQCHGLTYENECAEFGELENIFSSNILGGK